MRFSIERPGGVKITIDTNTQRIRNISFFFGVKDFEVSQRIGDILPVGKRFILSPHIRNYMNPFIWAAKSRAFMFRD